MLDIAVFLRALGLQLEFCGIGLAWLIIWILVAVWVYQDAQSRNMSGVLWLIVVILLGLIGIIIYLIVRASHPAGAPPYGTYPGYAGYQQYPPQPYGGYQGYPPPQYGPPPAYQPPAAPPQQPPAAAPPQAPPPAAAQPAGAAACRNCGNPLSANAKFCAKCGAPVG